MSTVTETPREPKLVFRSGANRGRVLALEKEEIRIGRDSSNDIVLPYDIVSSFHATLRRDADGAFWIEDHDSKNGTYLRDLTTLEDSAVERSRLRDGDVFCICHDGPEIQFVQGTPELPSVITSTTRTFRRTGSLDRAFRELLPSRPAGKGALSLGSVSGVREIVKFNLERSSHRARIQFMILAGSFLFLSTVVLCATIYLQVRPPQDSHSHGVPVAVPAPPAAEALDTPQLVLELQPIYASLFLSYRERPIGEARITHGGEGRLEDWQLEFRFEGNASEFLVEPFSVPVPSVEPGETVAVPIAPKLSNSILSDYTREVTVRAALRPPGTASESAAVEVTRALFVYGRHVFNWEEASRVAAFIDPNDAGVRELLRAVWPARPEANRQEFPPPHVVGALTLLTGVADLGLRYLPDATNPISARADWKANDRVSSPSQTLLAGSGDCDDLSVLCCSLLEAAGIPTAFAVGSGHVFFLFDTGLRVEQLSETAYQPETVVPWQERVWIPVEATELARRDATFAAAWAAAWPRREALLAGEFEVVVIREAWRRFQPLDRPPEPETLALLTRRAAPRQALAGRVREGLENLRDLFRENLAGRVAEIEEFSKGLEAQQGIALLYARSGLFRDAQLVFEKALFGAPQELLSLPQSLAALKLDANLAVMLLHLAICASLGGRLDAAASYAEAAVGGFAGDAVVERGEGMLRLALIHRLRGDLSAEKAWLERALKLEPSLDDLYKSLLRGDGAVAGPEAKIRGWLRRGLDR